MSTDSESVSSTNVFPYAEGYAFDWNEDLSLNAPELHCPRPCKHQSKCYYKNKDTGKGCGFVHPGEEGTGRKLFPGRTVSFKDRNGEVKDIDQGPCVRLIGNAEYYLRMKARMSWQEWQQMKQKAAHQAVLRVARGEHYENERHPRSGAAAAGGGGAPPRRAPAQMELGAHVEVAIAHKSSGPKPSQATTKAATKSPAKVSPKSSDK
jgi:hypothetical protein